MTVEEIKTLLKSDVLQDVEIGIQEFATYVAQNSDKKQNATYAFFDIDKKKYGDEKLIPIEELDAVLEKFDDELETVSLVNIIHSTLHHNIYDNFVATLEATKILIKRKSVVGQNAVIESFKKACTYYDAGHRYWGNTVQDQLLDNLFHEFEGEPLVNLLTWCSDDFLNSDMGLDGMDALFETAFEKIKDKTDLENKLLKRFEEYVLEYADEGLDEGYIEEFQILEGYENTSKKVQEAIASLISKVAARANESNDVAETESKEMVLNVVPKVKLIVAEQLGCPESMVLTTSNLIKDLGADELDSVELIMAFEDEFDIEITDEEAATFITVADVISYMEQKLKNKTVSVQSSDDLLDSFFDDDMDDLLGDSDEKTLDAITEQLAEDSESLTSREKNAIIASVHEKCQTAEISSVIKFIEVLPKIKNKEFRDLLISSAVANLMYVKLSQQKLQEAYSILKSYTSVLPIIGQSTYLATGSVTLSKIDTRQSIASHAVVLAVHMKNNDAFEMAEQLIPEHISNAVLAFNLCCWYGVTKNKEKLLHYTNLALNLGKTPAEFMNDSDFDAFKKDPDFLEVLN